MASLLRRPVLVYDGRCGFCKRWIRRWRARTGRRVLYVPLQLPLVPTLLGISRARARRSVQLVEPSGRIYEGADAVFRTLRRAPGLGLVSRLARLPGIRALTRFAYRRVARHRVLAARVDRLLFGRATQPSQSVFVRSLFLRALGAVYLMAFTSLRRQVRGLYGERGLLPIREVLDRARDLPPKERYRWFPSIFWASSSDETLVWGCRTGQLLSVALMLGLAPRLALAALWALYLSFSAVGRDFLGFQWDGLLLETSLYGLLVAPSGLAPKLGRDAPRLEEVFTMRWLVWRFYYEAGIAKLKSEDPTWRERTACSYHYETQPLPTPLGWYAHHLPPSVHRMATTLALAIECGAPFLAFAPRGPRRVGFAVIAGLQKAIAATGNYGFFNVLAVTLALWLLDDESLGHSTRITSRERPEPVRGAPRLARAGIAGALFLLSFTEHVRRFGKRRVPPALVRALAAVEPLQSIHSYGLFTSMTVRRTEIVIEGSDDGESWLEYEFKYKPGNPKKRPRWNAPHQPRLDWQMWFAPFEPLPPIWFVRLLERLLEGAPDVLALLAPSPFPSRPPRYVRALLYEYRMTDIEVRRRTGLWWERKLLGPFFPVATLASQGSMVT